MSDQELSELLSHPRVRSWVERVATQAAEAAYAAMSARAKQRMQPGVRPAASGDLNYVDAATFIGCNPMSIRSYACTGVLDKGKLHATVTMESCTRFKARYRPRLKGRGPRRKAG